MKKHTDWLEKIQTINSTAATRRATLKLAKAKTTHELATAERSLVAAALTQLARQLAGVRVRVKDEFFGKRFPFVIRQYPVPCVIYWRGNDIAGRIAIRCAPVPYPSGIAEKPAQFCSLMVDGGRLGALLTHRVDEHLNQIRCHVGHVGGGKLCPNPI